MTKGNTYLAALDLSSSAEATLVQAARMTIRDRAHLHAVYVLDRSQLLALARVLNLPQQSVMDHALRNAKEALINLARQSEIGLEIRPSIRVGSPVEEILKAVSEKSATFLFIGLSGMSDLDVGSGIIAGKCLRNSTSHVMLLHKLQTARFKRVVACVDFSPHSEQVSSRAHQIAEQDSAQLALLHVYSSPLDHLPFFASYRDESTGVLLEARERLQSLVKGVSISTGPPNVRYEVRRCLNTGRGIVEYAREIEADLIVLATHGIGGLRSMLLGSTAERVLREAPCSLLFLRSDTLVGADSGLSGHGV